MTRRFTTVIVTAALLAGVWVDALAQTPPKEALDSIYTYEKETEGDPFVLRDKYYYTYRPDGQLLRLEHKWLTSGTMDNWNNALYRTHWHRYNNEGKMTEIVISAVTEIGQPVREIRKITAEYYPDGKLHRYLYHDKHPTLDAWKVSGINMEITYTASGNPAVVNRNYFYEASDGTDDYPIYGQPVKAKTTYTYNANNLPVTITTESTLPNSEEYWLVERLTLVYDTHQLLQSVTFEMDEDRDGNMDKQRFLFTISADNISIRGAAQAWIGNAWVDFPEFDSNTKLNPNKLSSDLIMPHKKFSVRITEESESLIMSSLDLNDFIPYQILEQETNSSKNKDVYFYSPLATSTPSVEANPTFTVSPNPATDYITLNGFPTPSSVQVAVHDLCGRKMLQLSDVRAEERIATGHLPAGIYIVSINGVSVPGKLVIK